ncbi:MAG TPA: alkaline phosphatase family protein [Terriglobales bacterium]|nr:alkaline phosphatase family protein [Terriglobales bacterium]
MKRNLTLLGVTLLGLLPLAQAQVTLIRHVVFIFKEKCSFDHLFGTMPGVNGATQGKLSTGQIVPLSHTPDRSGNYAHDWVDVLKAINMAR